MDRYDEAKEAIQVGLSFEPDNKELAEMLKGINTVLEMMATSKKQQSQEKEASDVSVTAIPVS